MQNQETYATKDKTNLGGLWQTLNEGKWLIASITGFMFIASVVYVQLLTPTYKASTYLSQPLVQSIQELNQKELNQKEYSAESVFARFLINIQSRNIRQLFFEEHKLLDLYTKDKTKFSFPEVFEEEFNQKLTIEKQSKADPKPYTALSFELKNTDPALSASYLNAYVAHVSKITKNELLEEVRFDLINQKNSINETIARKKEFAKQRRIDHIKQLEESLVVVKKLGIEQSQITQSDNKLNMNYNRGSSALEAELSILKARESDEPFIDDLRNLQERIAQLNNLAINSEKIAVVRVDQQAEVPYKVLKPKKRLIVAVAVVLGLMLGVFAVLVHGEFRRQPKSGTHS